MKTLPKTAVVALVTATLGLGAIAPTFAQDTPARVEAQDNVRQHNFGPRNGGPMASGDFLSVERGAEAIEIALVRLSYRLELTSEQQPLFDAFKTAALSAATDFATTTEGLRPTPPAEGATPTRPNFAERIENGITLQEARLAALKAIQPSATAFFNSLTEDQTASLTPQRPEGGLPGGFGKGGPRDQGQHHGGPNGGPAPEDTPAPPANG